MPEHPGFLSRSVAGKDFLRPYDPLSDEAAQVFLRSQNVKRVLDNTFKDTEIEFQDLDGLSWPEKSTTPQANPSSPLLTPLFSPEKHPLPPIIYETGWINVPQSPACCRCDFERSACQLHPRKLSRSRRSSQVSLTLPRVKDSGSSGAPITSPPVEKTESKLKPFKLLELPSEEGPSPIGPPPGLPSPLPGFQPLQSIPFPTQG